MKLIDLYKKWMEDGMMPDSGLCYCIPKKYKKYLCLFKPTTTERNKLPNYLYWASEEEDSFNNSALFHFNKLRQTIVLLICAMHDEL